MWLRSALSSSALLSSILPPEAGPDGGSGGERRPPGPPRSLPITSDLVYWILEQVYHISRTLSRFWDSFFRGGIHGLLVGEPEAQ